MRKTKIQIIEETVEYYSADTSRRGVFGSNCVYYAPRLNDEVMCAVGRCIKEPKKLHGVFASITRLAEKVNEESLDNLLKEEYRGHSKDFWQDLQGFHDTRENWNEHIGLTEEGETNLKLLLTEYENEN